AVQVQGAGPQRRGGGAQVLGRVGLERGRGRHHGGHVAGQQLGAGAGEVVGPLAAGGEGQRGGDPAAVGAGGPGAPAAGGELVELSELAPGGALGRGHGGALRGG